jgi:hypothetical protein
MKALYAGSGTDDGPPMDRPVAQIDPVPRVSIQVFCESPDLAATVSAAISDRRMAKAHIKLNMGGAPAAVEAYKSAPTPMWSFSRRPMGETPYSSNWRNWRNIATPGPRWSFLASSTTSFSIDSSSRGG